MGFYIGAVVLNFMLFFNKLEASGLRRVSTMPDKNDREGIDHFVTSRLPTQSSSTYNNPPLLAHQALDLGGYQPYSPQSFYQQIHGYDPHPPESSHQHSSRSEHLSEIPHLVNKYHFQNGRRPNFKSREWISRNNAANHEKPECSQEYAKLENVEWLVDQTRKLELGYLEKELKKEQKNNLVHMPSMRTRIYRNWHKGTDRPRKKPSQEEEKTKKQKAISIREPVSSQNNIEESKMNPPATRETGRRDKGKGKVASRKDASGSRAKGKAAVRKNVSNSHDQLSRPSQHSKHDSDEFEPVLIDPHLSNFNPYLDFPQNDPNHPNQWSHPGASGSGSHQ